jgi:transcriptional regulator with XRE-family HTH domain
VLMQYIYMNSSYEIFFHNVRKTLFSTFHRLFNTHFRTMKMVTTNLKADKTNMALLSELLGVSPLGLKNLEKERMTLRFYKPLMTQVKRVAEAKNISVNLYLEQAVVEKLKMDSLSAELRDEVDTYSLLKNKNIDELAYLKKLLTQTLQDNNRLKKAVEKYRSTNNGMEFESFELF